MRNIDHVLEAFLYGEIGIDPHWFPWKIEALVAAGVLSDTDGEWWIARAAELTAPGPPVPDSVRERVAA